VWGFIPGTPHIIDSYSFDEEDTVMK